MTPPVKPVDLADVEAFHGRDHEGCCTCALIAEVRQLREERDRLQAEARAWNRANLEWVEEQTALRSRLEVGEKLAEALRVGKQHASSCYEPTVVTACGFYTSGKTGKCICSITDLLRAWEDATAKPACTCVHEHEEHGRGSCVAPGCDCKHGREEKA